VMIASTPRGQMASAVLLVLLAWAVLTRRVYVFELSERGILREVLDVTGMAEIEQPVEETPPAFLQEETVPEPCEEAPREVAYRRRWPTSSGTSSSGTTTKKMSLKAWEIHEYSGPAPRDKSGRLRGRAGAYWSEPDQSGFKIRGPTYLMDKVKVPVGKPLFCLLDCDLFELPKQTNNLAKHLTPRIDALWRDHSPQTRRDQTFTIVIQLQVPGPPWKSFTMYFGLKDRRLVFDADAPFCRVAKKFFSPVDTTPVSGDAALHKWRNNTFKLIPRCVNAPFVVKRAVGEVPTLLGNKLQQSYHAGNGYFEVDVNISSSRIAQYTVGLALNYAAVVVCDLAFVLQGASPAELPEQLVGCMRIEHINMKDAQPLHVPPDDDPSSSSSS